MIQKCRGCNEAPQVKQFFGAPSDFWIQCGCGEYWTPANPEKDTREGEFRSREDALAWWVSTTEAERQAALRVFGTK